MLLAGSRQEIRNALLELIFRCYERETQPIIFQVIKHHLQEFKCALSEVHSDLPELSPCRHSEDSHNEDVQQRATPQPGQRGVRMHEIDESTVLPDGCSLAGATQVCKSTP